MRESLYEYCFREDRMDLLKQWDSAANLPLTPAELSRGSKKKVWWRCDKGHCWRAAVYTRTGSGTGCPVCAGKVPLTGENDLATLYPNLASQWHPTRNGTLTPSQVSTGSHRLVWWVCEKGHVWRTQIRSRVEGCGCPVCADREIRPEENSLAVRFPQLAAQWHPTRNGNLMPDMLAPGTNRQVWWRCEKGHAWLASVSSRTVGGSGCPVCAGRSVIPGENDLATFFPAIADQWHPEKNGNLTPECLSPYSNHKVWWMCPLGHEYQATVAARTGRGSGCPYCTGRKVLSGFNDLAALEPEVAKQWHPTLNGILTPEMVTVGSSRRVWWECDRGHVWKAAIYSRTGVQKCGCPICGGRIGQKRLERYRKILAASISIHAPQHMEIDEKSRDGTDR